MHPVYQKIPTRLREIADEKSYQQWQRTDWVVTEKVHGANFSFSWEGGTLGFAKRKAQLSIHDQFFAFQRLLPLLEQDLRRLFHSLESELGEGTIVLYGELFGGHYPHQNIEPVAAVEAVQTGVWYAPDIHFYAFVELNIK